MAKIDVYEEVTKKVLQAIDAGTAPWRKPWQGSMPMSMSTNKPYRGINLFLLDGGYWGTYKKITELGGQVRKGEKGTIAVFWKRIEKEDADGNDSSFMMLRYYKVFHSTQADWADGMPERFQTVKPDANDAIAEAEQVVTDYKKGDNAPTFTPDGGGRAFYSPSADSLTVPELGAFDTSEDYYSTLFHEMGHSTGHASRLNREGVTDPIQFGSHKYAAEELVAEMTAAMLMGVIGMEESTIENSAAYLAHWREVIANDNRLIVKAAAQAQKAADLIRGVTFDKENADA